MYWTIYETLVLLTGIELVVLAVLPISAYEGGKRGLTAAIGGALIIASFVTGNMSSFTFPAAVWIGPLIPVLIGGYRISDARKKASAAAQRLDPNQSYQQNQSAGVAAVERPVAVEPVAVVAVASVAAVPIAPVAADAEALRAADPTTDLEDLADIAFRRDDLRAVVAANPSAYTGLLDWLAELDDPLVRGALEARGHPL